VAQPDSQAKRETLRPHPDVVARRVVDEVVLVQLRRNEIYALNRTGARLWELLSGGTTSREAIERMLGEFDVSRAQLESEVESIVLRLLDEGLLVVEEA
jgi:hypothetical protein